MWLISKFGFVSVVEHRNESGSVIVRARARNDLEQLCELAGQEGAPGFEQGQIEDSPNADYHYRLTAPVDSWKSVASAVAERIDYDNFKNEIAKHDPERAGIYSQVWADLMKIQFPDSDNWVDKGDVDRGESVARLYRMAADHLQERLDDCKVLGFPEDALGEALDPPALAETFGSDPVAMLEYRMIQRIGLGCWHQATGRGFDRLREAIGAAEMAADMELTDSDWVPPEDSTSESGLAATGLPRLIPNSSLLPEQVPGYYLESLDPVGFNSGVIDPDLGANTEEWNELWTFALTFDGYQYFGQDDGALERLGNFAASVERSFQGNGQLPSIDLAMLRACLFVQQRHWLKWAGVMTRSCPPETVKYLDALLRAIRIQL